jgi:hypothetical protein
MRKINKLGVEAINMGVHWYPPLIPRRFAIQKITIRKFCCIRAFYVGILAVWPVASNEEHPSNYEQ